MTGAPVRRQILDVDRRRDRQAARRTLGLPDDRFVIAVMGGSQGSGVLNEAIWRFVAAHRADTGLAVRHAVGDRFLANAPAPLHGTDEIFYIPVGYEPNMSTIYAACDVLVGRGGASTAHEVAATGTPAVLVPWADSAENHQTLNVTWLSDEGAAIHLPESQLGQLDEVLERLRRDPDERRVLERRAFEMGEVHRTGGLARLIESVAAAS